MGTGGSKEEDDGLVAAAAAGKLRNTARILSEAPVADINFDCPADEYGNGPLHVAAFSGHEYVCRYLVSKGMDINAINDEGDTPLLLSVLCGSLPTVAALCELGATAGARNNEGYNALHYAAAKGHFSIAEHLIRNCSLPPREKTDEGWTPLMCAVLQGQREVAQMLATLFPLSLEDKDYAGDFPLKFAMVGRDAELIRALLLLGAPQDMRDREGKTVCDIALAAGRPDLAALVRVTPCALQAIRKPRKQTRSETSGASTEVHSRSTSPTGREPDFPMSPRSRFAGRPNSPTLSEKDETSSSEGYDEGTTDWSAKPVQSYSLVNDPKSASDLRSDDTFAEFAGRGNGERPGGPYLDPVSEADSAFLESEAVKGEAALSDPDLSVASSHIRPLEPVADFSLEQLSIRSEPMEPTPTGTVINPSTMLPMMQKRQQRQTKKVMKVESSVAYYENLGADGNAEIVLSVPDSLNLKDAPPTISGSTDSASRIGGSVQSSRGLVSGTSVPPYADGDNADSGSDEEYVGV